MLWAHKSWLLHILVMILVLKVGIRSIVTDKIFSSHMLMCVYMKIIVLFVFCTIFKCYAVPLKKKSISCSVYY